MQDGQNQRRKSARDGSARKRSLAEPPERSLLGVVALEKMSTVDLMAVVVQAVEMIEQRARLEDTLVDHGMPLQEQLNVRPIIPIRMHLLHQPV